MAVIRVRVGAQLEPGAVAIFQPLIAAAKQARAKIGSEGAASGAEFVGGYRTAPAHARAAGDAVVAATQRTAAQVSAIEKRAARERERDAEHVFQIKQRYLQQEEKAAEKALAKRQKAVVDIGGRAASTFGGYVSRGVGLAGNIARGAGVDLDIGGRVGRAVSLSARAVDVVNQAELGGQAQGPGAAKRLEGLSRSVAAEKSVDANKAMDVLASFQAKSSDLATAEKALGDLAELARATGTSFDDMGAAAGAVNAQLEDSPDKADKLLAIMRHITAQTATGQVEMSDFAKYMPRLASGANAFAGDYSKNIGTLGAIAQLSIKGGASNAAEATGSAAAFARDIRKQHTLKAMSQEGLSPFVGGALGPKTELLNPEEIIISALKKTGGNQAKLSRIFANTSSYRGVEYARHLYTQAGGGDAGEKAVRDEFKKYGATISTAQVKQLAANANDTMEAKVQRFNNQLDAIAARASERVLPAMEKLAPAAADAAGGLANMVAWAAENPWKAVGTMAAAAIGKEIASAGIKSIFESGLKSLFGGIGGTALTIAAGAVAIEQVGEVIIDKVMKARDQAADEETNKPFIESEQKRIAKEVAAGRPLDATDRAALVKEEEDLRTRVNEALQAPTTTGGKLLYGVGALVTEGNTGLNNATQTLKDAKDIGSLEARLLEVTAQLQRNNALLGGTINVNVQNQPGSPVGPGARGTRTGPDAH